MHSFGVASGATLHIADVLHADDRGSDTFLLGGQGR
jgi:hypothetical protein